MYCHCTNPAEVSAGGNYCQILAVSRRFGNGKNCDIIKLMQEIVAKIEELRQRIASVSDCL